MSNPISGAVQPAQDLQMLRSKEDLTQIQFHNGVAAVHVAARLLSQIQFRNDERQESARLDRVRRSIRAGGFNNAVPLNARIGRLGRWVILDGGHRLTAARQVMGEFWPNLFRDKVDGFYFLLETSPASWSKLPGGRSSAPCEVETDGANGPPSDRLDLTVDRLTPAPGSRSAERSARP